MHIWDRARILTPCRLLNHVVLVSSPFSTALLGCARLFGCRTLNRRRNRGKDACTGVGSGWKHHDDQNGEGSGGDRDGSRADGTRRAAFLVSGRHSSPCCVSARGLGQPFTLVSTDTRIAALGWQARPASARRI